MFNKKKNDALLASIRNGNVLSQRDKINLVLGLSLPSILAQITTVLMFYIDTAMVGALGAKESAGVGLIQAPMWLYSGITVASAMGFSVQVAHFIGAGDTFKPVLINLLSMWGVRLTLAAFLAPAYGLKGVWIAMAIELFVRGSIFLWRLTCGNWMKLAPKTAS